jgi:hypothetical protein
MRGQRLLDPTMTAWYLRTDETLPNGRKGGNYGIAGGAPGVNGDIESDGVWTVIVLANLDPPAAVTLGQALLRQLSR